MASGKLIVFSAPSGSGKTTIVRHLLSETDLPLDFSISAASREPRVGEVHGKDYYFLSAKDFKEKVTEGAFLEWEEVYKDNFYGTLKSEIDRIWEEGKHVIFDIDVVGGLNIKQQFSKETLAIFVQPPSIEEMERRLRGRATESEEKIKMRVAKAEQELDFAKKFDTILVNNELDIAKQEAYKLVSEFLKK
ncbi:guanylate kinase [Wenyingzhuangia sp. 2_MG-2023]|uniref:guanylate kinase n=1 Tax=Wenyingzhuangia sp. 2_MG-2023 TaxID=3062639 RepID=UPI0026E2967E|nr:guanylate kinase [Wenyingzhuangia sp. 2_MG-2023]MDO6737723.1 guanylate kinase [Wenyingzhuangia sp. 2_MG-2023]